MLPQEARLRGGIVVWLLRCVDTVRYVVCLHGKTTRVFFPSSPVFCFGVGVFARFALLSLAMVVGPCTPWGIGLRGRAACESGERGETKWRERAVGSGCEGSAGGGRAPCRRGPGGAPAVGDLESQSRGWRETSLVSGYCQCFTAYWIVDAWALASTLESSPSATPRTGGGPLRSAAGAALPCAAPPLCAVAEPQRGDADCRAIKAKEL
jgi:hypothetical protein